MKGPVHRQNLTDPPKRIPEFIDGKSQIIIICMEIDKCLGNDGITIDLSTKSEITICKWFTIANVYRSNMYRKT